MRKLLLATSALVAFAGAAQAAESPIQVTVGGYVDFRAAQFSEMDNQAANVNGRAYDFDTEYKLQFAAEGKAANGVGYGAMVSLTNDTDYVAGGDTMVVDQGYVWMSGAFGKVLMGDETGASDLFVYAPTVGQGQIDGNYTNYVDQLTSFTPTFISNVETATKVTYYTPKVGNEAHKIQLGASYTPNASSNGTNSVVNDSTQYGDVVEAVAQYTGSFDKVSTVVSAGINTGDRGEAATARDYTAWGIGAQAMYAGFTVGGSYVDAGEFNTASGLDKNQTVWTGGVKYEFDKVALAVNGEMAEGYAGATHVEYDAVGFGATYTWFPGMTSAADLVFFAEDETTAGLRDNKGHVAILSQKMTF